MCINGLVFYTMSFIPHTLDYNIVGFDTLNIIPWYSVFHKMGNKQTVFTEEQLDNYVVSKMYLVCAQKIKAK